MEEHVYSERISCQIASRILHLKNVHNPTTTRAVVETPTG
jgi:hypothetical protein